MKKVASLSIVFTVNISVLFAQVSTTYYGFANATLRSGIHAQNRNSITGFVFNESRRPLSDVYVELLNDVNATVSRTKTGGSGLYTFRGLPQGQYYVKVLPYSLDYDEQIRSVSLVGVSVIRGSGAVSEQVDFYLKQKKNANAGPLAAPGVIFAQEVPVEAKKLYEAGIEDLRRKKETEGLAKLTRSLDIFPDYYLALDRLGTEYVMRGHFEPANLLLTKAVEINPQSFSSRFGLGLAKYRLQQIDQAVDNLKRATEIYDESVNAYLWLGIALHSKNRFAEAQAALLRANKLGKGQIADVHWQLARLYKDQNRFKDAADELELFLKYSPGAQNAEKIRETIKILRQKASGNP